MKTQGGLICLNGNRFNYYIFEMRIVIEINVMCPLLITDLIIQYGADSSAMDTELTAPASDQVLNLMS